MAELARWAVGPAVDIAPGTGARFLADIALGIVVDIAAGTVLYIAVRIDLEILAAQIPRVA